MGRQGLRAVAVGRGLSPTLVDAVRAALDDGDAVLPVPVDGPEPLRSGLVAAMRPDDPAAPLEADGVALVVPTSGSTGAPKGALLSREAVRASAAATAGRLSGPGTWVLALPATHVAGLMVLVRALLAGGLPTPVDGDRFEPVAFAAATARARSAAQRSGHPLYTSLVPTQLDRVLAAGVDVRAYDAILLGAAAADLRLLERARDSGARVVTTYGMTETCGGCVYDGRPLDGVRVGVGTDAGSRTGARVGRVLVGGATLAAGYRLDARMTAESFADGWFRTGDTGRWDGTHLVVDGRLDDVVVSGGEKVVPGLVERALSERAVAAGTDVRWCVVGVPDDTWGQRVVAVLAAGDDVPTPDVDAVRTALRDVLPAAWLPRQVMRVLQLPMLASGKVDRVAVAAALVTADAQVSR
jgi:o-succinylbenzoate---CoA ligase